MDQEFISASALQLESIERFTDEVQKQISARSQMPQKGNYNQEQNTAAKKAMIQNQMQLQQNQQAATAPATERERRPENIVEEILDRICSLESKVKTTESQQKDCYMTLQKFVELFREENNQTQIQIDKLQDGLNNAPQGGRSSKEITSKLNEWTSQVESQIQGIEKRMRKKIKDLDEKIAQACEVQTKLLGLNGLQIASGQEGKTPSQNRLQYSPKSKKKGDAKDALGEIRLDNIRNVINGAKNTAPSQNQTDQKDQTAHGTPNLTSPVNNFSSLPLNSTKNVFYQQNGINQTAHWQNARNSQVVVNSGTIGCDQKLSSNEFPVVQQQTYFRRKSSERVATAQQVCPKHQHMTVRQQQLVTHSDQKNNNQNVKPPMQSVPHSVKHSHQPGILVQNSRKSSVPSSFVNSDHEQKPSRVLISEPSSTRRDTKPTIIDAAIIKKPFSQNRSDQTSPADRSKSNHQFDDHNGNDLSSGHQIYPPHHFVASNNKSTSRIQHENTFNGSGPIVNAIVNTQPDYHEPSSETNNVNYMHVNANNCSGQTKSMFDHSRERRKAGGQSKRLTSQSSRSRSGSHRSLTKSNSSNSGISRKNINNVVNHMLQQQSKYAPNVGVVSGTGFTGKYITPLRSSQVSQEKFDACCKALPTKVIKTSSSKNNLKRLKVHKNLQN